MTIQWYPGHMAKARQKLKEQLKLVDLVLEVADCRIPAGSRNPDLQELLGSKPKVLVLNKKDLASPPATELWLRHYQNQGLMAVSLAAKRPQDYLQLSRLIEKAAGQRKRKALRLMVAGIPNVGKSTVLNGLARGRRARTGRSPGVTRGQQWVRLDNGLELLDTPGVLWPKITSAETGCNLAAVGAVGSAAFDVIEVALYILGKALAGETRDRVMKRYELSEIEPEVPMESVLELICRRRGLLVQGGEPRLEDAARMLLKEFQTGLWGPITLENPPKD